MVLGCANVAKAVDVTAIRVRYASIGFVFDRLG